MLKLISWNVNGLRACYDKGFTDIFRQLDADFFCLQGDENAGGTTGFAIRRLPVLLELCRKERIFGNSCLYPTSTHQCQLRHGRTEHDREGRIITLEMEDFFLVNVYTPNSQEGLKRLEYRMTWEDDFLHFLKQLETQKPVIVCGDLNVAHQEIDLKNPKTNRKNAGFTDEERNKFTQLLSAGFTDTFRYFYPDQKDIYSWWSYRFKAREKNAGWRIDYFLASASLNEKLCSAKIHTEIFGSDHCPVELEVDL